MAKKSETVTGQGCAILAYLLIGIIWYFADKDMQKSEFAKYHVKQGLALLILAVIIGIISSVFWTIAYLGYLIPTMVNLILVVLWIIGIINAASGKTKPVPIIGPMAEKFSF